MTSTTDRERLAGLLAVHADHIAAAIRTNAVTALPENKPGMEWAAGLLKLHKANLLADERPAGVELLLDAMLAGLGDQLPASSGGAALLHETADALWNHPRASAIDSDFRAAADFVRAMATDGSRVTAEEQPAETQNADRLAKNLRAAGRRAAPA